MLLQSGVAQLAKLSEQCKDALASKGSSDPMDMSMACMCETKEELGNVGLEKDWHNLE